MANTGGKRLPEKTFSAIYRRVPRLCVDVVIRGERGIVLAKRSIDPWRGAWHIPGGTVYFGKRLTDAVQRVAELETSLSVRVRECLGFIEYLPSKSSGYTHAVSMVFLAVAAGGTLRGGPEGEEVRYFSRIPKSAIAEQRRFLRERKLMRE